jgi:hypothetical protein
MAKNVTVNITSHPLSREENGVVFVVLEGEAAFGELIVSKGGDSLETKNKQDHHFINWKELDSLAPQYPRK